MVEGKLKFDSAQKTWKVEFYNEKKKAVSTLFCRDKSQFSSNLQLDESLEIEVEFERLPNGDPIKIRPKGQEWKGQEVTNTPNYNRPNPVSLNQRQDDRNQRNFQTQQRNNFTQALKSEFHNPYSFVPAIPRDKILNDLADAPGCGHSYYFPNKFSGTLNVSLTTETPLLLLDTARMKVIGEHKSFPFKIDSEGKPYIEPTAIKGMLRAAYEAITNSRMAVFNSHEERLAFRGEAKTPISAVIEKRGNQLVIRKLNKVAVLVRYRKHYHGELDKLESQRAMTYPNGQLPEHGDSVWVRATERRDRNGRFLGHKVTEIKPKIPNQPLPVGYEEGWVCVTGANIKNKVYERVFIRGNNDDTTILTSDHLNIWNELIKNYQEIHKVDLEQRKKQRKKPNDYLGDNPGETAWSRQIDPSNDLKLKEGALCYLLETNGIINAIIPVMISRQLFEKSPAQLLPETLKPVTDIEKLSPADRVFGCVIQNSRDKKKAGAYRGQVRVGSITTNSTDSIQFFAGGLPLNILGQPKPQQGRFYVAKDKLGNAQDRGLSNEQSGYNLPLVKGLRGRKVYPHHTDLPNDYWFEQKDIDFSDKNKLKSSNQYREYLRPPGEKQRNDQNRSIEGWVKPKTEFSFDIHFTNLSEVELGALIWLLDLNDDSKKQYFHRLGGGKPFGFGSVMLSLKDSQITDGEDLKDFYNSLDSTRKQSRTSKDCQQTFINACQSPDYQNIINSFLRSCEGFGDNKPIHYPRKTRTIAEDSKSFEWFVANNKMERREVRHGYVLKNITDDDGLPYLL